MAADLYHPLAPRSLRGSGASHGSPGPKFWPGRIRNGRVLRWWWLVGNSLWMQTPNMNNHGYTYSKGLSLLRYTPYIPQICNTSRETWIILWWSVENPNWSNDLAAIEWWSDLSWGLSRKALKIELGESAFTHSYLSSEILRISIYNVYLISISYIYTDIICIFDIYTYNININRHHIPIYSHDTIIFIILNATSFLLVKTQYSNAFGDDIVDPATGHVDHVFLMLRRLISTIAASKTIGTQWKATCACFSQTMSNFTFRFWFAKTTIPNSASGRLT